jgi:tetratricopeptide (TPR) repeat protein
VIDKLQTDKALDEPVRKLALQIANSRKWEDAEKLNRESWEIVSLPNQETDAYRLALENSERANRLEPNDPSIIRTLGVAQYRVGMYEDALKTLTDTEKTRTDTEKTRTDTDKTRTGTDKILTGTDEKPEPANLAFMAMALHKLGRTEEAKAALERLRGLLKDEKFANDQEAQGFLREVEQLIKSN